METFQQLNDVVSGFGLTEHAKPQPRIGKVLGGALTLEEASRMLINKGEVEITYVAGVTVKTLVEQTGALEDRKTEYLKPDSGYRRFQVEDEVIRSVHGTVVGVEVEKKGYVLTIGRYSYTDGGCSYNDSQIYYVYKFFFGEDGGNFIEK